MHEAASSMTGEISKEEAFYHLLKKERAYYKTLLELTRQENTLLKIPAIMPGWRAIHPLLQKKRALLKCIHEIELVLTPLKAYWHSKTDRSDNIAKKILQELQALNLLLEEILQLDASSHTQMEKQLHKLKEHGTRPTP